MYRTAERARLVLLFVALLPFSGCIYGLKSAGGFPANIRTMYVAPIDNRTVKSELDAQVFTALTGRLTRALGLRPAGERNADAVLRVQITRYDDQAQNYRPNDQGGVTVLQHEVQITVTVQIV